MRVELRVEGRVATVAAALDNGRGQDVVYGGDLHHRVEALYGERGVPTYLAHRDVDGWGSMMGACLIASRPAAILCKLLVCRFVAGSPSARSHRRGRS